jgi:hypothetical protein
MSRQKGVPDDPDVRPNPALDQLERWTKACTVWNDCETCPHQHACHNLGDFLITYLSNPHLAVRIKVICSSSIT